MESILAKNHSFPPTKGQLPKNPHTGLPRYPLGSPLSFNLPLHLLLDSQERNFIDNLWANNRNPSFPKILTSFSDYLHTKNLKSQMNDPTLRPKSLDAFLELQHTNQVLAGEVADLQQQLAKVKKEYEKAKNEKDLLKREWEKDYSSKEKTYEKFPRVLSPVQTAVMKLVYAERLELQIKLVETLQTLALTNDTKIDGLSFCLTRYKGSDHPEIQACVCKEGFSIIQASISLFNWKHHPDIDPNILFEMGLLRKIVVTEATQLREMSSFPAKLKVILASIMKSYAKHFAVLEIKSVPPHFSNYPIEAQHYIKIDLVHHHSGTSIVYQWDLQEFHQYHTPISTNERIKRWRAYALGIAPINFSTNYLVGEEVNLKIYSSIGAKNYKNPMKGTLITDHELTDHFKKCKASWFEITKGDNKIFVSEIDGDYFNYALAYHPDDEADAAALDEALDEIGEANLINAMEA